ncbi:Heat shock transcription factor [Massospora cicadina]|nr:Heat shock transcription factor [Massospora cicadina]
MSAPYMDYNPSQGSYEGEDMRAKGEFKDFKFGSTPDAITTNPAPHPSLLDAAFINSSPYPGMEPPDPLALPEPSYRKKLGFEGSIFGGKNKRRKTTSEPESGSASPPPDNYEYFTENGIAPFIKKLFNILNDPANEKIVKRLQPLLTYSPVANQYEFCLNVLPKYYKHKNMASFVRQLNLYGFTKIQNLRQGVLNADVDSEKYKFRHPKFQKGRPELLSLVRRKQADNAKEVARFENAPPELSGVYSELDSVKKAQRNLAERLKEVQLTNEKLLKTNQQVMAKYHEQQETIDKILHFLGSLFSEKPLDKLARRRPLLLERSAGGELYPQASADHSAALSKLMHDLSSNHLGEWSRADLNDFALNSGRRSSRSRGGVGALLNQRSCSDRSATRAAAKQLAQCKQTGQFCRPLHAAIQDLLKDKAKVNQAEVPTAISTPATEFLNSFMLGPEAPAYPDFSQLYYGLNSCPFTTSGAHASGNSNDASNAFGPVDALSLGNPTGGVNSLTSLGLGGPLPFNEEVTEIVTEPPPAPSKPAASNDALPYYAPRI